MNQQVLFPNNVQTGEELLRSQKTKFSLLGVFFGFPKCCSIEFENNFVPLVLRDPLIQEYAINGFVPCLSCALKLASQQEDYHSLINHQRICSIPFKSIHTSVESDMIDDETDIILKKYLK